MKGTTQFPLGANGTCKNLLQFSKMAARFFKLKGDLDPAQALLGKVELKGLDGSGPEDLLSRQGIAV
jgi:hypothetical protein